MAHTSKRVSEQELRKIFKDSGLEARFKARAISFRVKRKFHYPSPKPSFEPHCTKSEMVDLVEDDGTVVASCHRYMRPDGTIGASGKIDPKFVLFEGILYRV